MVKQTSIADSIDVTDRNAQYDQSCKRLLANRMILAWILKETAKEFQNCSIEEIAFDYIETPPEISAIRVNPGETNTDIRQTLPENILGRKTEDNVYQEGVITYDIHFQARCPEGSQFVKVFVNVEAQKNFYPGYALQKRGIFYCCRMISAQYETEFTGSDYNAIKKVYSIWICMNPAKRAEHSITKYRMCKEPVIGTLPDREDMYDLLTVVMICLGHEEDEESSGIIKLLDILFSKDKSAPEKNKCWNRNLVSR